METVSSLCGCAGWDLSWIIGALFLVAVLGPFLAAFLVPDFYWLGYGVVGKYIHVRLFHLLPVYFIPISNIREIRYSREGAVTGNPITWFLWFEITRAYAVIDFKRPILGGLLKSVQITPFFADRFVGKVRAVMEQANRRDPLAPMPRNHRNTRSW
jgi:hypothetical protein